MDGIRGLQGVPLPELGPTPAARPGASGVDGFGEVLGKAIGQADRLQLDADAEAGKQALGAGNLHETALALEKADVAMRVLTKVRNKVVEAYQEVMRMGV
jgi:flagellar hook-basal body complex protein FliE